ncbi:MAG TPA: hypothetical protein VHP30_11445 [Ignavibacteriales bacterium]|nr:hypothetical protein [Ignavibacteriales bacterium]
MKRLFYLLLCIAIFSPLSYSQSGKVYVGIIEGEIDLGLIPYVKRVISEAEKNNASAVIFKVNTFGGRVDAATEIKDAILNTDCLTPEASTTVVAPIELPGDIAIFLHDKEIKDPADMALLSM